MSSNDKSRNFRLNYTPFPILEGYKPLKTKMNFIKYLKIK